MAIPGTVYIIPLHIRAMVLNILHREFPFPLLYRACEELLHIIDTRRSADLRRDRWGKPVAVRRPLLQGLEIHL